MIRAFELGNYAADDLPAELACGLSCCALSTCLFYLNDSHCWITSLKRKCDCCKAVGCNTWIWPTLCMHLLACFGMVLIYGTMYGLVLGRCCIKMILIGKHHCSIHCRTTHDCSIVCFERSLMCNILVRSYFRHVIAKYFDKPDDPQQPPEFVGVAHQI